MNTSGWCAGDVLRLLTLQPQAYQDCHHRWVSWRHLLQHRRACLRLQWGGHQQHGAARERSNAAKQRLVRHSIQEGAMHIIPNRISHSRWTPGRPITGSHSLSSTKAALETLRALQSARYSLPENFLAKTNHCIYELGWYSLCNISAFLQPQWNLGNLLPVHLGGESCNLVLVNYRRCGCFCIRVPASWCKILCTYFRPACRRSSQCSTTGVQTGWPFPTRGSLSRVHLTSRSLPTWTVILSSLQKSSPKISSREDFTTPMYNLHTENLSRESFCQK